MPDKPTSVFTPASAPPQHQRIRIFLKDGQLIDCGVTLPWLQWMQQMLQWHGVLFEGGWIPIDLIKLIAPLRADNTAPLPDNVVPFSKKS